MAQVKVIDDITAKVIDDITACTLKPWPNDCNMPTQHVATLLGATCCVRLPTVLRRAATCWVLLAQGI